MPLKSFLLLTLSIRCCWWLLLCESTFPPINDTRMSAKPFHANFFFAFCQRMQQQQKKVENKNLQFTTPFANIAVL
jgi:hypothetical protein